jgi:hypothetical protein
MKILKIFLESLMVVIAIFLGGLTIIALILMPAILATMFCSGYYLFLYIAVGAIFFTALQVGNKRPNK